MTINDIMIREIAEAEREERAAERAAEQRGIAQGEALTGWACKLAWVLGIGLGVFLGWCIVSAAPHRFHVSADNSAQHAM